MDRDSILFHVLLKNVADDKEARIHDETIIRTMYKMIEDVDIVWDGRPVQKKILYITNKQASLFDDWDINKYIDERTLLP
jgi:hypothetical protein